MDQSELVNLVKQGDEAAAYELVSSLGTEFRWVLRQDRARSLRLGT